MTRSTPPITPERWRAIDQILQGALVRTADHRDEFVAKSCGNDAVLRNEVSSLLAVHDATPADFLERPAIEEHGLSSATAGAAPAVPYAVHVRPGRLVSARFALYAAAAGIALVRIMSRSLNCYQNS